MEKDILAMQRLKDRYFRPVQAHPNGFLTHYGDCSIHRALSMYGYAPCDCGLLKDLVWTGGDYKEKLYPHFWHHRTRQEVGRYRRNPITTPIEELFPNAKLVEIPDNSDAEWADIETVFGKDYTDFLKSIQLDSHCSRCETNWSSAYTNHCPYCFDAFPTWKVISGGQTGADIAGLVVAKQFQLETGGWMPKGFRTTAGCRPEYHHLYGVKEDTSADYVPRTIKNVADSDGTIRLAANFSSPGERCTLRAIKDLRTPHIDVDLTDPRPVIDVIKWIEDNQVYVLNVAGNSATTYPEAERQVMVYLTDLFSSVLS